MRTRLRELARRGRLRWTLRDLARRRPILVYQMGKVGSSSVAEALEHALPGRPVLHVHTLQAEHLRTAIARHRAASDRPLDEHLLISERVLASVRLEQLPCHIITLTREPIGRALSFAYEDWRKKIPAAQRVSAEECVPMTRDAVNAMLAPGSAHADPALWFDSELKATFGVDVFSREYDVARGYTILPHPLHPVLVIRMEDLNRSLRPALREFLGVETGDSSTEAANRGEDKWYAAAYDAARNAFRVEADVLTRITGTRYFRHFYADRSDAVHERWGRPESSVGEGFSAAAPRQAAAGRAEARTLAGQD